jgi:hypothetical protein
MERRLRSFLKRPAEAGFPPAGEVPDLENVKVTDDPKQAFPSGSSKEGMRK